MRYENGVSRIDQLVKWASKDADEEGGFNGVMVFDEGHKAKKLVPEKDDKATYVYTHTHIHLLTYSLSPSACHTQLFCLSLSLSASYIHSHTHTPAHTHTHTHSRFGTAPKSTKTALCVKDLQDRLPNARVVYVSATGASSLENLA
jgi:hypothetical protein